MKKTLLYILVLLTTQAFSNSIVNGVVLKGKIFNNENKKPLQGATIKIHDTKIVTTTSADGYFETPKLNPGVYYVEIKYIGFASIIESIEIVANTEKNFYLKEAHTEQEEVIVTGVSSATKLKNNPQSISIVTKADLNKTTSTNIIDAISKTTTGFNNLSTGPAISKPIIRGLGFNRLVTIHDGVRQEGQQWGEEHGIEIDENSIQRAEVLKGASSLMYGSDAMAGVLNLLGYQPVQQGTSKANVSLGYIDNNGLFTAHTNFNTHYSNGFNWNVYGSYKNAGDYKNKFDGTVLNSRFAEYNFGAGIGLQKNWGFTQLQVTSFNQKIGMVEGARDSATGKFLIYSGESQERIATNEDLKSRDFTVPFQKIGHLKVSSNSSFILKNGKLNTTLSFQQNTREEFGHLPLEDHGDLHFDLKTLAYNIQYQINEKNGFKSSFGVNGMQQSNHNHLHGDHEPLIPDYHLFDFGIFAVTQKKFNKGVFSAGVRFDNRSLESDQLLEGTDIKFAKNERSYQNFSGSVGLSYFLSKTSTLKLNVARGFRAPTVTELSSNGAHEGTGRFEIGDQNLKAETSLQFDASFEYSTEHINFNTSLFFNRINNYIFASKLNAVNGGDSLREHDGDFETAYKYKQNDAFLYGFEASLDIHPHPLDWLHIKNSFSYVRGNFVSNVGISNNLPLIPQPRLLTEIRGDFKSIKNVLNNVYIKFEADNFFAQNNIFSSFNTETATPAFTLLNLGFGGEVLRNKKTLFELYFSINNIADVAYQNHLSRLKYTDVNNTTGRMGVFNMGRNFSLKLNIPLSFKVK